MSQVTRRLAGLLLVVAFAGGVAAQAPKYVGRLALPVRDDAIGYARAVTADPETGEVFVCDSRKSRILIFDSKGRFTYQIPGGRIFSAPRDLAVDPAGYLLVVANHRRHSTVVELDFDGRFIREIRLSGLPEVAAEPHPFSVALTTPGDTVYVLDRANLRVWISDRDGHVLGSVDVAEGLSEKDRSDVILGKIDVYGDTLLLALPMTGQVKLYDLDGTSRGSVGIKGTASCKLAFPVAAALNSEGNVVIVDQQRMILMRWSQDNRCLGDHFGPGVGQGFLYYPLDMSLDRSGRLYVSQGLNGWVQAYEGLVPASYSEPRIDPPAEDVAPVEESVPE